MSGEVRIFRNYEILPKDCNVENMRIWWIRYPEFRNILSAFDLLAFGGTHI